MTELLSYSLKKDDLKKDNRSVSYESGNRIKPALRRPKKMEKRKMNRKAIMLASLLLLSSICAGVSVEERLGYEISPDESHGTVIIWWDGSIDPPTAPIHRDRNVYTFTGNITDEIQVYAWEIVIDGRGYTVTPPSNRPGIHVRADFVTIKNVRVFGGSVGIRLSGCNNELIGNYISGPQPAVGIGIAISPVQVLSEDGNILINNTVLGMTIGVSISKSGYNWLFNNNVSNNGIGILLAPYSGANTIAKNTVSNNLWDGISICDAWPNKVLYNTISNNTRGIYMEYCLLKHRFLNQLLLSYACACIDTFRKSKVVMNIPFLFGIIDVTYLSLCF